MCVRFFSHDLKTWMCHIAALMPFKTKKRNSLFQLNSGKTEILFFDPDLVQKENAAIFILLLFF